MVQLLWAEFIDLSADTPLPPGTTELQKLAVIGVLLLRAMLVLLLLTPIGLNAMWTLLVQ